MPRYGPAAAVAAAAFDRGCLINRSAPLPLVSGGLQDAAENLFLHRPAGAERDAGQGIVGDGDREPGFVAQHLIEALRARPPVRRCLIKYRRQAQARIFERDADTFAMGNRFGRLRRRPGDVISFGNQ